MKWALERSLSQVATSLIHSITDKSSKLRLLIFEIRGVPPRRCFTRGWSPSANLVSDGPHIICEHLVKYHIPEYKPMPDSTRAKSRLERERERERVLIDAGQARVLA